MPLIVAALLSLKKRFTYNGNNICCAARFRTRHSTTQDGWTILTHWCTCVFVRSVCPQLRRPPPLCCSTEDSEQRLCPVTKKNPRLFAAVMRQFSNSPLNDGILHSHRPHNPANSLGGLPAVSQLPAVTMRSTCWFSRKDFGSLGPLHLWWG